MKPKRLTFGQADFCYPLGAANSRLLHILTAETQEQQGHDDKSQLISSNDEVAPLRLSAKCHLALL